MSETLVQKLQDGEVILINKPLEWTSFDVVNYIRNCVRRNLGLRKLKLGHAGTLDPLASGLLILCSGKATKRIEEFQDFEKVYTCTMNFSGIRPSFDMETEIEKETHWHHLTKEIIEDNISSFIGDILQVPPAYSAIKVGGVRAYEKARKQEDIKLKERQVSIHEFKLLELKDAEAKFYIRCSKGTYIRSLARDLGEKVGCGAYLCKLERIAIGDFGVQDALSPDDYCSIIRANT